VRLHGKHGAGLDRLTVKQDGAGAALAGIAANVGAGEAEINPEKIDQQSARLNLALEVLTVDSQANSGHGVRSKETAEMLARNPVAGMLAS
jgi:hypothetical protein